MQEFSHAFESAYEIIVTDIYASAREKETLGISGKTLVEEIAKHHAHVYYGKDAKGVSMLLDKQVAPGDLVIFMGAGDIYSWSKKLWMKSL